MWFLLGLVLGFLVGCWLGFRSGVRQAPTETQVLQFLVQKEKDAQRPTIH